MNFRSTIIVIMLALTSFSANALQKRTFCIYDPVGRNGPVMSFYSDVIPKAMAWGVKISFNSYTDEKQAAADFKAGKCEAVLLSAIMSRQFVKFGGTMDAIGAINSEKSLELLLRTLARPKAGKLMTEGNFEVVATFPIGSMYAFVNDRSINSIQSFSNKRISVLNNDPQARGFVRMAGGSPVVTTLSTFGKLFNNGQLDIVLMPALAYNTFELYRGLGVKGGIIKHNFYYGMLQTVARKDRFPKNFGHKMRAYVLSRVKDLNQMIKDAEKEIPAKYWIDVSQHTKDEIDVFSKKVRGALVSKGVNNDKALKLLWKIRCRADRTRAECKRQLNGRTPSYY